MRRVLGGEQDLFEEREVEQQQDVVLGTTALLGIFLAVALVCAICFGFGYSRGHGFRGVAERAAVAPTPTVKGRFTPRPLGGSSEDSIPAAPEKPAPGVADAVDSGSVPLGEVPGMPPEAEVSGTAPPKRAGSAAALGMGRQPALEAPQDVDGIAARPHAPFVAPEAAQRTVPVVPAANLMVQIAAVSRAADAQTLASALRHDGFAAVVRTSTTDSLFHVQIGPFSSFTAAKEVRGRLADNGYNAFIKP